MSQHPNIVALVDLFENSDYYYIVLEFMQGKDLFDYIQFRSFTGRAVSSKKKSIIPQHIDLDADKVQVSNLSSRKLKYYIQDFSIWRRFMDIFSLGFSFPSSRHLSQILSIQFDE